MSKVNQLIQVQDIDREVYGYTRDLAEIPKKIAVLKQALESEKVLLKDVEAEYKDFQVRQKGKETELGSKEDQIRKFETQLNSVKTNKEYSALQSEINNHKADKSILEEQILKFFEEVDSHKRKIEETKKIIQEAERKNQEEEKKLLDEKKRIETLVAELKSKKKDLVKDIDPQILDLYERILTKKEGSALVLVRGGGCGACGMNIRPQLLDELRMADHVVICESCARILYLEPSS